MGAYVESQTYRNEAKMLFIFQVSLIDRFMPKEDDARPVIINEPEMIIDHGSLA